MKTLRDEKCRTSLIARVNALSVDCKPSWGKMNVEQMVSHLVQAGELPFVTSVPDRSSFLSRNVIKHLVLYVLPIPKEVKTSAEMDQQQAGRKPLGLETDKSNLVDAINKLGELSIDYKCLSHPFFGKLSAKQWGMLGHKHIDHHLRQFGV